MQLGLEAMSEHNGYYEVAVTNIHGSPRIWDFWSPPRDRKEESKELCEKFIKKLEVAANEIVIDILKQGI